ncbi:MAG: hypothetical protein U0163_17070 [Gemmatimonadaceae bacterium]
MPPDLAGLLSYLRAVWQAKLIEAFELNLIPASGREEMPRWLDSLQKLQAQALLTDTADKKQASLADLCDILGSPQTRMCRSPNC